MYEFLTDLDDYFCEKYANYDKLCVLEGYRMPKMQETKTDEFGDSYSYTLPAETMRLALQENKAELLKVLKGKMLDKTFSFSFRPISFFRRIGNSFSKTSPKRVLQGVLQRYQMTAADAGELLTIDEEIWKNIAKGKFAMTKNTIFSLALAGHFSLEDTDTLLELYGYGADFTIEKDVVVAYLLKAKVFNRPMVDAALAEYKIENLFIK